MWNTESSRKAVLAEGRYVEAENGHCGRQKLSSGMAMKKNDLLENLKKHSRYKTMFKFEEDHIVISSQKEAAAFIKMLNDDIVRSELTGKEYDSSSKMLLGPVGASH